MQTSVNPAAEMSFIFAAGFILKKCSILFSIKELYNKIVIFRKYVFQTKESRR